MEKQRVTLYLPADLWQRLRELAQQNRRKFSTEVEIAIERHLAAEEQKPDEE
jgi:predicted transcriptional regulator